MAIRTFAVPEGFEVSEVRVRRSGEFSVAQNVRLATEALLDEQAVTRAFPADAVDANASVHPARSGVSLGAGTMAGQRVHGVAVFPVEWNRATGDLSLATTIDVELQLVPSSATNDLAALRPSPARDRAFSEALAALVENPQDVRAAVSTSGTFPEGFAPRDLPSVNGSPVDMVIVTTAALETAFQPLADWKTKKGVGTQHFDAVFDRLRFRKLPLSDLGIKPFNQLKRFGNRLHPNRQIPAIDWHDDRQNPVIAPRSRAVFHISGKGMALFQPAPHQAERGLGHVRVADDLMGCARPDHPRCSPTDGRTRHCRTGSPHAHPCAT